ncbi:elongation factor-like GTPase 1 [Euwallacea fornicatus]|uniref:elongation factor-like GTPase 1 n=1 Tax=Euwallacea fornicatus TaxID=995702 RepID=UPI00338E714F
MEYIKPTIEELKTCMKDPDCIRNICILAHVDHGKTTVADLLLATNRVISKRMAGTLRYLDDRLDEQERGITMKSSVVSLLNIIQDENKQHKKILLNLIDTPGHIDFSSEVGAAIRVSDGALILVDAAEGVCAQTREAIKKAYEEYAKMILVINKIDRLIMELSQDVSTIFQTITKIIEDCNVVIAEVYQYGFTNSDVDIENTGLLFSPDTDNVVFASAADGWAFTTKQFSHMAINLVKEETVDSLNKKMWDFNCWVDSKGFVRNGAIEKLKPNIFTQLCLKTIVYVYHSLIIRRDDTQIPIIMNKLGVTVPTREMLISNDPKLQLKAILSAWSPMAYTLLIQCLNVIPSPSSIGKAKIGYLLNVNHYIENPYLNKCVEKMVPYFKNLSLNGPTIAYVSKMFCVKKQLLNSTAVSQTTFIQKPRVTQPNAEAKTESNAETKTRLKKDSESEKSYPPTPEDEIKRMEEENAIIGLTRVFTGSLRVGQEIYTLLNGYLPNNETEQSALDNKYLTKVQIKKLYILIGRNMVETDYIPAGNMCGVDGLETTVIRTATLSTELYVVPLVEHPTPPPVVRYAIQPVDPKQLQVLRHALKLLMQSDSCVQVMMQETGELVLLTAGDVHLAKCLEDLTRRFTNININVSEPMVALRETVLNDINEVVPEDEFTSDYRVFSLKVVQLPKKIRNIINNNHKLLQIVSEYEHCSLIDLINRFNDKAAAEPTRPHPKTFKSDLTNRAVTCMKDHLKSTFESCASKGSPQWASFGDKIWSVGKIQGCANILINNTEDYVQNIFLETNVTDKRTLIAQCLLNAFHTFLKAGPICNEPITNCAFIVSKFRLVRDLDLEEITPQMSSAEESSAINALKTAFQARDQRLMEPLFRTTIQVNPTILGKVYSVVNRRHGNVLEAVGMDEKEKSFLVEAEIPVLESHGFANDVRKATSGHANPSLRFGDYQIVDANPYTNAVQHEEESEEEFGIRLELSLRANRLRRDIRKRKGLPVDDEVVVHAEKQRTLNKKK